MKVNPIGTLTPVVAPFAIPLTNMFPVNAQKDRLADTPSGAHLGMADADFSNAISSTTSGGTITQGAECFIPLPANYIPGAAIKLRVRAKVSATQTTQKLILACYVKTDADGGYTDIGNNVGGVTITTSFADYDLTLTPTNRVPGEEIVIYMAFNLNGTGGYGEICHAELQVTVWG